MAIKCFNNVNGLGSGCGTLTPITDAFQIGLLRPGASFADAETFCTKVGHDALIASGDLFIVPTLRSSENQKVDDRIHQTPYGDKIFLGYGKRGKRYVATLTKDQHKIFFEEYSDKKWSMIIYDRNNNIQGILEADGTVTGRSLDYFHVFQQMDPTEADPPFTPFEYQEEDTGEWDTKGCFYNPDFRIKNIAPVTPITITAGTITANAFQLTAAYVPALTGESDGTASSYPVTGLAIADLEVIDQTGAANALVSVTESTTVPGTYTVTGDTLTSGTAQVIPNTANASLYKSNIETLS